MFTQFKRYISDYIITAVTNYKRNSRQQAWEQFKSEPSIHIHPTFTPKNAEMFKGDNKKLGAIVIGENVLLREYCTVLVFPEAELTIGKGVFFNNHCSINCLNKIEIGDDTIFGEGVKIYDHNHVIERNTGLHVEKEKYSKSPVKIGRNCWIGSNVVILKGVTIGDNTVIGAGCVIYKSVPSNTVVKNNQNLLYESL